MAVGRDRAIAWSGAALVLQAAVFVTVLLAANRAPLWFVLDFPSFYGAGSLVLAGTPELAYDQAAHWHAEQLVAGAGVRYAYFFYPPPFLLLCAALACLPYAVAYVVFEAATLALYLLAVARIAGWTWCVPALAFPAVFWNLGLGQNGFLTAALFGAGTLLLDQRPLRGGALLGLLCYKPHLGVLLPVALAAGRQWRAFVAAAAVVLALVGGTLLLFGAETWRHYLQALAGSGAVYGSETVMLAGYVTVFGSARLLGFSNAPAVALQLVASLAMAILVGRLWWRRASVPVRSAALIAGTLLSVPLALVYDLLLISVCVAWLVRAARETGFLPWEKISLVALYGIALVSLFVGDALHVPLGVLAPAIVVALCLRRGRLRGAKV